MTIKELKELINILNGGKIIIQSYKFGVLKGYQSYDDFWDDESLDHKVLDEEGCAVHVGKCVTIIWVE